MTPYCYSDVKDGYSQIIDVGAYGFDKSLTQCLVDQLGVDQWIDFSTSEFHLKFIIYNGNNGLYTMTDVYFSIFRGGRFFKKIYLNSIKIRNNYLIGWDFFRLFLEILCLLLMIVFTYMAFASMRKKGVVAYFKEGGILDALGQGFLWVNAIVWVVICVVSVVFLGGE